MKNDRVLKLALLSFILNIAYGLYNAALGLATHSWWFITLSAYYIVLSVMRFALLRIKETDDGVFAKKFTGIMLIVLAYTLSGMVILSVVRDRGIKYHEIVMITIALYTFTKIVLAIINLCKAAKSKSNIVVTLRNVSFADALVSIFSLQRSMLVSFPGMAENDIRLFNILTGSAVCVAVFMSGLNLLNIRRINMAKSKLVKANEKIAGAVVDGYKKIEKGVVCGYKKVEKSVVDGYTKIEDKFVDTYLTRDGETVEEAKERLKNKNK